MKYPVVFASFLGVSALWLPASAGEMADACTAQLEAEGRDASGCSCLEEEVMANPSLAEEFQELGSIADPEERYSSASADAQAAMDKCTR